jgi:hypothetical protein
VRYFTLEFEPASSRFTLSAVDTGRNCAVGKGIGSSVFLARPGAVLGSLASQSCNWIHAHRAAGRDIAGRDRDKHEHYSDKPESEWVG